MSQNLRHSAAINAEYYHYLQQSRKVSKVPQPRHGKTILATEILEQILSETICIPIINIFKYFVLVFKKNYIFAELIII